MASENKLKPWVVDLLVAILATTISIVLTFGSTALVDRQTQKKERRLTALMVMSNIESFARSLDEAEENLAGNDSVAVWLMGVSADDVVKAGDEPFWNAIMSIFTVPIIRHDRTAETIFGSTIDTWKNMGNFQFIDNVGSCFSQMNWIEDYYNEYILEFKAGYDRIKDHPADYPGATIPEKCLRDASFRQKLYEPHALRTWLSYNADRIRTINRKNMELIDIPEDEVIAFTDAREVGVDVDRDGKNVLDFNKPYPDRDSLAAHLPAARLLDSLLKVK